MMVQFIEFFVTANNKYSTERVQFVLGNLKELGTVKGWKEQEDGDASHFTVTGTWTAYSTVTAMIPKKRTPENSIISISIEHFEDDL